MKKLALAIVAVGLSVGAFAQSQSLGYGFKAGVNFPSYNFSGDNSTTETSTSTNFHVTGYLDAPLSNYLYVQPGISLQGKGAKFNEFVINGNTYEFTQNTMWLEVPVNLVAKLPTGASGNFFVGAGPYAGFGLSGKNKFSGDGGSIESDDFEFGDDGDLKGFDFGLNFLAGYQLTNGLFVHGGYGLGLTNLSPGDGDVKQTNRVWSVGLGFAL
ncbi:porin family protein [Parapedobacter sp. DT-150]|uniref:porin family protein n=1 Tax=Parapedobacter sp. DT-150 TaxID=3396162 RepID=UPI003F1AD075